MRISALANGGEYVATNSRGAPFAHYSEGYAAHRFLPCPIRQCDSERRETQHRLKLVSGLESTINQVDRGRYRYPQHERTEHEYHEDQSAFTVQRYVRHHSRRLESNHSRRLRFQTQHTHAFLKVLQILMLALEFFLDTDRLAEFRAEDRGSALNPFLFLFDSFLGRFH